MLGKSRGLSSYARLSMIGSINGDKAQEKKVEMQVSSRRMLRRLKGKIMRHIVNQPKAQPPSNLVIC